MFQYSFTQICDSALKSWYSFPQVILTGDASGGSGARIFRSSDFGKSFIHTELPFHPLMQIMYKPQNSDVLAAISVTVRAFKTLVLFHYRLKLVDIKWKVTNSHLISLISVNVYTYSWKYELVYLTVKFKHAINTLGFLNW